MTDALRFEDKVVIVTTRAAAWAALLRCSSAAERRRWSSTIWTTYGVVLGVNVAMDAAKRGETVPGLNYGLDRLPSAIRARTARGLGTATTAPS